MRTLEWDASSLQLRMINQRAIPSRLEVLTYRDYQSIAEAIQNMTVRGAPAIGVAAAYGIALAAVHSPAADNQALLGELKKAATRLRQARPTAVNLTWALDRMLNLAGQLVESPSDLRSALIEEANRMADEDVQANLSIAKFGADLIQDGDTIIHHCNTGALATVDWGTALGIIRMAHEQGKHIHVLVDETRPRLQGARLTAWELQQYGIPYEIITDNSAGYFLWSGKAQKVLFGADRVAANGDVANKVGSYMLALAAHQNHIPVYSVFPCSTVDLETPSGQEIPVEERSPGEVLNIQYQGEQVVPAGASARNPAFDITPSALISAYVTEMGIIQQPFEVNFRRLTGGI